jgi:hypothetical protein
MAELEWLSMLYESGTTIVTRNATEPHLYIYGDASESEDRYISDRCIVCDAIRDFLNGGIRPQWLDDFERISETEAKSLTGASIEAVGPMIDCDPPNLHWIQDPSAHNDRAKLMDSLFLR